MGGEAFELLANGHGSGGLACRGWALDGVVEAGCISGGGSGLLVALEEALAELRPAFLIDVVLRGEALRGVLGVGRFFALNPVERDLLPEGDVPEFFIDGVRGIGDFFVGQVVAYAFENVGWGCGGAVAD